MTIIILKMMTVTILMMTGTDGFQRLDVISVQEVLRSICGHTVNSQWLGCGSSEMELFLLRQGTLSTAPWNPRSNCRQPEARK